MASAPRRPLPLVRVPLGRLPVAARARL